MVIQKLKLLKKEQYPKPQQSDPLPFYYWPVIGKAVSGTGRTLFKRFTSRRPGSGGWLWFGSFISQSQGAV